MKSGKSITGIILLLLSFLTVQTYAQRTSFDKKEEAIIRHNDQVFYHAKAMERDYSKSGNIFNHKSYLKHAKAIKTHTKKAKAYTNKLLNEEKYVKEKETKFNGIIEHYDKILQEEFQIEEELGMPTSDRHKLASHLSVILDELEAIKKKI